jgi:alpha-mannosidase
VRCGAVGFASDALYAFQTANGCLLPSVVRATRFADDRVVGPEFEPWRPVQDTGESRFSCLLAPADADLGALAEELAQPVQTVPVAARPGKLPRRGGLLDVAPSTVRVLAVRPVRGGVILRLHNEGAAVAPKVRWQGKAVALGKIPAGAIRSWKLGGGKPKAVDLLTG